uniref:Seminal fluid protein HACP049 n=1 Tax=Heliconius melpomene TaxID=34740 RepID=D9HQ95_HELME|nr:seminal fluid protein HACP049 [Heliconius melpomene]
MCQYKWFSIFVFVFVHNVNCENIWPQIAHHPAWTRLDSLDCGFSASDRIIGGLNAALGQFPWLIRLGYSVEGEEDLDWMCGGSLITDLHLITAAHCVQTSGEDFELSVIRVGEYDTETNPDCQLYVCAPPVQDKKIREIKVHPNFNKPAYHNDLAIIVLDSPVKLNDYVLPICLPRAEQLQSLSLGELLMVAGWGKMNMTTEERARILQFVAVPVVDAELCHSFTRGFAVLESEICAGAQKQKDACGGDSGGPLMKIFDTPDGPKTFMMGVVSFGPTICGVRKPGVYTSVPHFLEWILDSIVT